VPTKEFPAWVYLSELIKKRSSDGEEDVGDLLFRIGVEGVDIVLRCMKKGVAGARRVFNRGGELLIRPDGFDFEEVLTNRGVSRLCSRIISNTDFEEVKAVRRRNYAYLLGHFQEDEQAKLALPDLPNGVCPLFFPILVESKEEREELYGRLRRRGIITHPWWDSFRREVPWKEFPDAVYLKESVLGFPIHQDLGEGDMNRILRAFEEVRSNVCDKAGCRTLN